MRTVQYERTAALREAASLEGHKGMALTINVSSRGMCLLMDWAPDIQDVYGSMCPCLSCWLRRRLWLRSVGSGLSRWLETGCISSA
jgi:hypothetical protein